jgi:hypothetical protein
MHSTRPHLRIRTPWHTQNNRTIHRIQIDALGCGQSRRADFDGAINSGKVYFTGQIIGFHSSVDQRRTHFTLNSFDIKRAVNQLDAVDARSARNGQRVLDAGRIAFPRA